MYEDYLVTADNVPAKVTITSQTDDYVPRYFIDRPQIDDATEALMSQVRDRILSEVKVSKEEFVDSSELEHVKDRFQDKANEIIEETLPEIDPESQAILVGNLLHDMLGLGDLELLLHDENLEEMVVNSAEEPVWAYHKEYGWLKTDLMMENEEQIKNYASMIGRRVGKQISNLNPLLDAHLTTGDRTNATIKPISTQGNTLTIRKFARDPWTITDFIENKTINPEVAALLWICIQYEMNIIVSGGTGSGKCLVPGAEIVRDDGRRQTIRSVVEDNLDEKTAIDDGWKASSDIPLFSLSDEYGIDTSTADTVWKREAPEKLIEIETYSGRSITTTPEHPFYVNEDGRIQKKRADELSTDQCIPAPSKLQTDNDDTPLDIRDWADERGYDIEEMEDSYIVQSPRGKPIELPKEVTSELSEITGLIAGDGHIEIAEDKSASITLHNKSDEVHERFRMLVNETFDTDPVTKTHEDRVQTTTIHSSALASFFTDRLAIPAGKKAGSVAIAEPIVTSSTETFKMFLSGLFEAEAYVNTDRSNIEFATKSERLAKQVRTGLTRCDTFSRMSERNTDGETYYRVKIGPDSLDAFLDNVGFLSEQKSAAAREAVKGDNNTNVNIIPAAEPLRKTKAVALMTDEEIAEKSGCSRRAISRYMDGSRTPSQEALQSIIDAFDDWLETLNRIHNEINALSAQIQGMNRRETTDCLIENIETGTIQQKDLEDDAGLSSGLISHWKNGSTPHPRQLAKAVDAARGQNVDLMYEPVNFSAVAGQIQTIRQALSVSPTEIREETGVDIGVVEADTVTKRETVEAVLSYLRTACLDSKRRLPDQIDTLRRLANNETRWDPIVRLDHVEPETEWVYDLTVPGSNTFVANDLVAHNTSMLGVLMPFIPSNNRIVSIEDTREIRLPEFLHWVPLTTREPNPEGKGGVSMNDLLVNSLRMRPDRIIVGEIRREKQAEVLFEAMHTGHSVYSTLHAETAAQTIRRLINPPINVPETLVEAIDLNVVMFRDRRRNIRRAMQVSEVVTDYMGGEAEMEPNTLYKWHARDDEVKKKEDSREVFDRLNLHAGLTTGEIKQSIQERKEILNWMVENQINDVDAVGKVIAEFYQEEGSVIDRVNDDADPEEILDL